MRIATEAGGRHAPLVCGTAVLAVVAAFTALAAFTAVAAFAAAGSGAASPHRASVAAAESASDARVQRDLRELVAAPGGPPGAIVTLFRDGRTTVLTAGVADVGTRRPPRATDYMRIASIAKAFSGAVTLELIRRGRLRLDDTIARRLPGLPRAWGRVTIRELLDHTGGVHLPL